MGKGQLTAQDDTMMEKVLLEARAAITNGNVGVGALLLWRDEILALGHNRYVETGDMTAHGEIVVLRNAAPRLSKMDKDEKRELTLYSTLEPYLMCFLAISFVGIKRVVYSALCEDANEEEMMVRTITCKTLNDLLTRGPIELVSGVRREEGRELLARMGKLRK